MLTRVLSEAFVDHISVAENAVVEAAVNHRDDLTWVRSASYQQNHGSASVMFQRQNLNIYLYLCYFLPPGEKPNSSRDHAECCECWFAMLCLLWIYETERWSCCGCLVGGMTVWLSERFRTLVILANMAKVAPHRFWIFRKKISCDRSNLIVKLTYTMIILPYIGRVVSTSTIWSVKSHRQVVPTANWWWSHPRTTEGAYK